MEVLELLLKDFPELNTEQYTWSKKIIEQKNRLKLSQEEMSFILGMTFTDYFDYENGSITKPVSDYKLINEFLIKLESPSHKLER